MTEKKLYTLLGELLNQRGESEWLEFKSGNFNPVEIGKNISAVSNGACLNDKKCGYLIFGVEDATKKVIGTEFDPSTFKKGNEPIKNWIAQRLNPRIDFYFHQLEYNGKKIIITEIQSIINNPVKFFNEAYIRIGSVTRKLVDFPEKEKKIWLKGSKNEFEANIASENLNENEILKLLDYPSYYDITQGILPKNPDSIINKFIQEKFIVYDSPLYHITNLGAILFAKNLTHFDKLSRKAVRVIFYKGKDKLYASKEQLGQKGYAIGFGGLINYINDHLPSNEEIGRAFRKEVKMYPELAIRELVANAIIHQDFTEVGTSPMVEIFEDRIEISNPGKPLISTLRFIDHNPQSRNEKLASAMRRLNICEERGSGIDKVITHTELFQLPAPNFYEGENFTKVTLYAYKTLRQMDKNDKIRACYQHCCLRYISNEIMTNQSLRERFQIDDKNYSTVSRIISDTISAELIKDYDPENRSKKYAKYVPFWA